MHRSQTNRWAAAVVVAAAALASPAHADRNAARELPTLRATTQIPGSAPTFATTVSLSTLDATQFQVLARPSKSSVVLGYPARNPCARTKVTLRLKPVDADPLTYVRAALATADGEGQETQALGPDLPLGAERSRAWRTNGDIEGSRTLVLAGVSATRVTKGGQKMLQVLSFAGRTTKQQLECATGNRFTIGPRFVDMLRLGR